MGLTLKEKFLWGQSLVANFSSDAVEHFLRSQVRGRVLVYIFKGRGQEWGETNVKSDLRAVTIASNEERAITIGVNVERDDHHYNLIRSLAVFSNTVQASKRFWIHRISE